MQRITEKMLQAKVDYLNELMGTPKKPYEKDKDGNYRAQIGNYHLSGAYGGWCLHQTTTPGGGINIPHGMPYGHVPKRELYTALCGFIGGIEKGKGI